jgi:hypothetical protein
MSRSDDSTERGPRSDAEQAPQQGVPFVGARDFPPAEMRWPPPTAAQQPAAQQRAARRSPRGAALLLLAVLALALAAWLVFR